MSPRPEKRSSKPKRPGAKPVSARRQGAAGSKPAGSKPANPESTSPGQPRPPAPVAPDGPPRTIRLAGLLVLLEGLFGVGFGIYVVVRGAEAALGMRAVLGQAGTFLVMGVLVAVVGIGLLRGRAWSRTPGIVVQAVLLLSAYTMLGPSRQVLVGALVAALTITTLMLLLSGSGRRWSMAHDAARREG